MSLAHDHRIAATPAVPAARPKGVAHAPKGAAGPRVLEQCLMAPDTTVHHVIERFSAYEPQLGLVVDARQRLLGTVTDGDVRRGLLRGLTTDAPVREIMNTAPRTARFGAPLPDDLLAYMRRERIKHLPVIDFAGRAVDLITVDSLLRPRRQPNPVVVMAGGKGLRLRPLTESTPKPMLEVGGRPILETIIRRCADADFTDFHISVNYRAEVIKDYFGDGGAIGVSVRYLEEASPLGTAGPLGLLPRDIAVPILVINGDVLSKVDLAHMVTFHQRNGGTATMGVREYEFQVPYGVVDLDNHRVAGLREKPVERYFINAGIYVIDPSALAMVPPDIGFDMPDLFENVRQAGLAALAFPIREYWVDIGHHDDFRRANDECATLA